MNNINKTFTEHLKKQNIKNSFARSKNEFFTNKKTSAINYKNIFLLRKYISIEGKILPRRLNSLNSKKQRFIAKSIKNARTMGFLPFTRQVN